MRDGSYNFGSYILVFTISVGLDMSVTPDGRIYGTVNYHFKTGTNIIFHLKLTCHVTLSTFNFPISSQSWFQKVKHCIPSSWHMAVLVSFLFSHLHEKHPHSLKLLLILSRRVKQKSQQIILRKMGFQFWQVNILPFQK